MNTTLRRYLSLDCSSQRHTRCTGAWFRRTTRSGSLLPGEQRLVRCTCPCHGEDR